MLGDEHDGNSVITIGADGVGSCKLLLNELDNPDEHKPFDAVTV
jgi:hypothetical protein